MSRQMLSASPGSLSSRYRSAFSSALGIASCVRGFRSNMAASFRWPNHAQQPTDRVVEPVDDPLLHRNDRVVGDGDLLRAHLRAALRDVAVADTVVLFEICE